MKFWRAALPNLCISLWLALLTLILVGLCAFASLASAITLYGDFRREAARRRRRRRAESVDAGEGL